VSGCREKVGELHNLYSWPDIIRITKSRRMRGARHAAHMKKKCSVIYYRKTWKKKSNRTT
jgi:hypothetical protein